MSVRAAGWLLSAGLFTACSGAGPTLDAPATATPTRTVISTPTKPGATPEASVRPVSRSPTSAVAAADPRWRFYAEDTSSHTSPWYDGAHRIMIGFGCTEAPYYRADPRCRGGEGFHHGIDVAIPCGRTLRAAVGGRIVTGGLGAAYGSEAFRIRTDDHDLVVGHAQEVRVRDGDTVLPGQPIAEVGALGAPDGCHLHLEQRSVGGGVSSATDPAGVLGLGG